MLRASITFFIIGLIAYVLGAYGIAGLSIDIGKIMLIVFLVLALVSFLLTIVTGRNTKV